MAALDSRADVSSPRAFPRLAHPSPRSHHAATVVGSTLLVHGGDAFGADDAPRALDLETMSWRALPRRGRRRGGEHARGAPASARESVFWPRDVPARVGCRFGVRRRVGDDARGAPAYVLELPGARESRPTSRRRRRRRGRSRRARGPSETRRRGRGRRSRRDATRPRRRRRAERRGGRRRARPREAARRAAKTLREKYLREKTRGGGREAKKEDALANAESAAARSDVAWVKIEAHTRGRRGTRDVHATSPSRRRGTREEGRRPVPAESRRALERERDAAVEGRKRRRPRPRRARTRSRWKS